jgi:hypothetical protein
MNYLNFSYKQLDLLVSSLFLVYTTFHVSFFKTNVHNIKNINLVTFAFTTTRRASTLERLTICHRRSIWDAPMSEAFKRAKPFIDN